MRENAKKHINRFEFSEIYHGKKVQTVTINGRTLYKNGSWNTLCLPFDVTTTSSTLAGATAMVLSGSSYTADTCMLTLEFSDAEQIPALLF